MSKKMLPIYVKEAEEYSLTVESARLLGRMREISGEGQQLVPVEDKQP